MLTFVVSTNREEIADSVCYPWPERKKKEMQGIRQERVKYTINSTHMHSQIERINVIYLMLLNGITCFYSFEINRVFH